MFRWNLFGRHERRQGVLRRPRGLQLRQLQVPELHDRGLSLRPAAADSQQLARWRAEQHVRHLDDHSDLVGHRRLLDGRGAQRQSTVERPAVPRGRPHAEPLRGRQHAGCPVRFHLRFERHLSGRHVHQ